MRKFFVRKDKLFTRVKTVRGFAFKTRGNFELQYFLLLGDGFDFIDEFLAHAQVPRFFVDVHLLDFADFSGMVQEVLDVATQKSDGLVFSKGQQVNDVRIADVFLKKLLLHRSVESVGFE